LLISDNYKNSRIVATTNININKSQIPDVYDLITLKTEIVLYEILRGTASQIAAGNTF
jgi:hypothetical protein